MKTIIKKFGFGLLVAGTFSTLAATNDLTSSLQKGLFEEDANHNIDKAIQEYQSAIAQFDKDRKLAGTAILHLAECYRKQGKTNEATAQYQRILREFGDFNDLVGASRSHVSGVGESEQADAAEQAAMATAKVIGKFEANQALPRMRMEAEAEYQQTATLLAQLKAMPREKLESSLSTIYPDAQLSELQMNLATAQVKTDSLPEGLAQRIAAQRNVDTYKKQIGQRIDGILQGLEVKAAALKAKVNQLDSYTAVEPGSSISSSANASTWKPSPTPDPQKILDEAKADREAGRYADALAKHVWFHENATKYNSGLSGVRLSFALSDWVELAAVYPPALEKIKAIRDDLEKQLKEGEAWRDAFAPFMEIKSINEALADNSRTRELFLYLDSHRPAAAKKVYPIAQPILIELKDFATCGKYVGMGAFEYIRRPYQVTKQFSASGPVNMREMNGKSFRHGAATIVALLVLNDRKLEAEQVAAEALQEDDAPGFKEELDNALKGQFPGPVDYTRH